MLSETEKKKIASLLEEISCQDKELMAINIKEITGFRSPFLFEFLDIIRGECAQEYMRKRKVLPIFLKLFLFEKENPRFSSNWN